MPATPRTKKAPRVSTVDSSLTRTIEVDANSVSILFKFGSRFYMRVLIGRAGSIVGAGKVTWVDQAAAKHFRQAGVLDHVNAYVDRLSSKLAGRDWREVA